MVSYVSTAANTFYNGVCATASSFMNLSPLGKAATVGAVALPILYCIKNRITTSHQPPAVKLASTPFVQPASQELPCPVHSWRADDKTVVLYQRGSQLEYSVFQQRTPLYWSSITLPLGCSVESCIDDMKSLVPEIRENNSAGFVRPRQSLLSDRPEHFVDPNHWNVCLADTHASNCDPTSWGGHGVILIESFQDGERKINRAHLTCTSLSHEGKVEIGKIENFCKGRLVGIGEIFRITRQQGKKLQTTIEARAKSKIPFSLSGRYYYTEGLGQYLYAPFLEPDARNGIPHNCITWALEMLELIGIKYTRSYNPLPFSTNPKDYVNPII